MSVRNFSQGTNAKISTSGSPFNDSTDRRRSASKKLRHTQAPANPLSQANDSHTAIDNAIFSRCPEADTVRFNLINPQTNNRIKMKTVDAGTGEEVSREGGGYRVGNQA
jgi:hypothetical protein